MSSEGRSLVDMVELLVRGFVSHPEATAVSEVRKPDSIILELRVSPSDLGRVIGRQGRTARALRTLVSLAGEKLDRRHHLQILD